MAAWMQPLHGQHGGVAATTPAGNSAAPPPRPVGSAIRDFGKLLFDHLASVSILAGRGRSRAPALVLAGDGCARSLLPSSPAVPTPSVTVLAGGGRGRTRSPRS
uniref:Uncharacterized protein n=1 Tax=Oryza meridionalis TaxID=40149 RepID=A0A0E0FB91_9ORYZ